ncbi:MAG: cysteine--tRNA ligase [Candidatus Thermoplasmatota archaeon]|nr:cysteine--tRNA ligase [Candidatus Thermoplasmatota archaeon]
MSLQIYNSLTRQKEPFMPLEIGKVKMYVCGMTVYSDTHIGHARTYLAFDSIRRYFEYKGYQVTYIQNITDVDDKIIAAANKQGIDPLVYSKTYAESCLKDLDLLGIRRADSYPKASETIPDMIDMISQLVTKGYAYEADGDVYFSVEKFPDYGKLSGQNPEEMKSGARIDPGEKKKNPLDFALWKQAKAGEPSWDSPWGSGRPGWHIECSTMSSKYLGLPFDIHGGGMDLRFPHHENEIAQAEAATGKPFAKIWMHIGLLTINGEKMSKSLGNILNVHDLLKSYDAEIIRMFFAQAHYRSPPDYSDQALQDTQKSLTRIHRTKETLEKHATHPANIQDTSILTANERTFFNRIESFEEGFIQAMDDDFNTPKAFAEIFSFITDTNRFLETTTAPSPALCLKALSLLLRIGNVLTLFQKPVKDTWESTTITALQQLAHQYSLGLPSKAAVPQLIQALLDHRETARKNKDWKTADTIRDSFDKYGIEIQDTQEGPRWRKK